MTGKYNEDIEQEVYIKTWKNLKNYDEQNKFKAWLNAITYNLCKDYLKSSAVRNQNNIVEESYGETVPANNSSPDEKLDSINRQKRILKEIDRLPKKLREVIIYHELEDKSYEDISLILNIPTGTVKSRLHNAKELLKIALEDLLQD